MRNNTLSSATPEDSRPRPARPESPLTPLGIKGAGEAGAIPVGPLFAQAIEDALGLLDKKVELNEIPLSPDRLFALTAKLR